MKSYGSARQGVMEKVIEHGADCVVVRTDSHDFTDTSTLDVVDIPADHRSRAISQNHLSQISVRSHLAHKIEKPLAGKRPNVGSIGERRRRCSRCGPAGQGIRSRLIWKRIFPVNPCAVGWAVRASRFAS